MSTDPAGPDHHRFRSSLQRTRDRHPALRVLGIFSSLQMAASLIAVLAAVLAVATYYERDYGRQVVAVMIYHTWWFAAIFALLAINIFGAAAVRIPWRKRHTGFVITHTGLLTLMLGFAFSGYDRLDGSLVVLEGERAHVIERERDLVVVRRENDGETSDGEEEEKDADQVTVPFATIRHAGYPGFWSYAAHLLPRVFRLPGHLDPVVRSDPKQRIRLAEIGTTSIAVGEVVDAADPEGAMDYVPAAQGDPALVFTVSLTPPGSGTVERRLELRGEGDELELGPLRASLRRAEHPGLIAYFADPLPASELPEWGLLRVWWADAWYRVPIAEEALGERVRLAEGLHLTPLAYYHRAAVRGGDLVDAPDAGVNPTVRFRLEWNAGTRARREEFHGVATYPYIAREYPRLDPPFFVYEHPALFDGGGRRPGGRLEFLVADDGRAWVHRHSNTRGFLGSEPIEAGWKGPVLGGDGPMTIATEVHTVLPRARPRPIPIAVRPDGYDRVPKWIELHVEGDDGEVHHRWIERGKREEIETADGDFLFHYRRDTYDLEKRHGFALRLERFINEKDPGGAADATYASEVTVFRENDEDDTEESTHVISMNEPLWIDGLGIYQSARSQLDDGRWVSIFTVAEDRGRYLKYAGTAILVAGILTLYFMRRARRRMAGRPA